MKKYFTTLFFIFIACIAPGSIRVFANEASSTPSTEINARILPTVWYSTLSINDGVIIKIYAGIQNNSGINFTGTATFYVDDKEISKSAFSSIASNLIDVSADWQTFPGKHEIQVKISTSLPSDKTLISYATDKSNISITQKITPKVIQDTANSLVTKIDTLASDLADKLESLKKPVNSDSSSITVDNNAKNNKLNTVSVLEKKGNVLGTSTSSIYNSLFDGNIQTESIFNTFIDWSAFLVRNWKWTLFGIVLLFLFFKLSGRRKK